MTTLAQFGARMERLANELPLMHNERKKMVTEWLVFDLTAITPVDESTALSNWQVGNGRPITTEIRAHVPGEGGDTQPESAEVANNIARMKLKKTRPGQTVFVSNNAGHIVQLNNWGTSTQAPRYFIEMAVNRNIERLKRTKFKWAV